MTRRCERGGKRYNNARRRVNHLRASAAGPCEVWRAAGDPSGTIPAGTTMRLADRYRLLRRVGEGGGGGVFLVEDRLADGAVMVLKRLHAQAQGSLAQWIVNEFQVLAQLDLPTVARVYDFGLASADAEDPGGVFFTRAYVEGAALDDALEAAQRQQRDEAVGQFSLFGAISDPALVERPKLPEVPPMPVEEQLASEKELLGFYVSGHPLRQVPVKLDWHVTHTLNQVANLGDNKPVVVGGLVMQVRKLVTKSGNQMLAARLEDFTDQVDIVAFPEAFEQHGQHLFEEAKVLIKGKVSQRDERLQIMVSQVWPLEAMPSLHLHLAPGTPGQQLALVSQSLRQHSGTLPVIFHFDHVADQVVAAEGFWVSRDEALDETLKRLLGADRVKWFEPPPRLMLA